MGNKIDIIGAGIAGLGTGCYLQMNGYNTEIFQLHHKLGGLCTSWKRNDSDQYRQEKEGIAQEIIGALDQRFGDFRAKVEMIDVSIPSTVVRNPSNWKESFEGWLLTPRMGLRRMKKVLPGLKQFYMAGRWVARRSSLGTECHPIYL